MTCSNTPTLSKLDILGAHHNEVLITAKERISQEQVKLKELTERVTDQVHACSGNCLEHVKMGVTDLRDSRCVPIVLIKAFIVLL